MLREVLPSTDMVGRVGGDEFSVLLPETDGAQARLLCRRLLRATAAADADLAPRSLSIGIGETRRGRALPPLEPRLCPGRDGRRVRLN